VIFVLFQIDFCNQNIVHLTAAEASVVYISKSELSSKLVALFQIVQAQRVSLMFVKRLFSSLNTIFDNISSESLSVSQRIDDDPSEKYISAYPPVETETLSHSPRVYDKISHASVIASLILTEPSKSCTFAINTLSSGL